MESRLNNLSLRFQAKGFTPIETTGLIKDIFTILDEDRYFDITKVNRTLEDLGWGIEIVDNVIYELILTNDWVQ